MVGPEFVFLRVFFSYKINVILINKLQQQQPSRGPNTLELVMDPQQTSKGRPNVFFSIFLSFLFFSFLYVRKMYI